MFYAFKKDRTLDTMKLAVLATLIASATAFSVGKINVGDVSGVCFLMEMPHESFMFCR
jgi:hypothetical protein